MTNITLELPTTEAATVTRNAFEDSEVEIMGIINEAMKAANLPPLEIAQIWSNDDDTVNTITFKIA